jgi:hypothetical protein
MNEDWWHWVGEVPAGRVKARTIKWVSKSRGREQLSIEWELGIGTTDMFLDRSHMVHQKYRTC